MSRILLRHDLTSSVLLLSALFLTGIAAGQLEHFYYPPTEIGLFTTADRQLAQLELIIDAPPRTSTSAHPMRPKIDRQFTRATVRRILTTAGWQLATGPVLVHIEPPDSTLATGQTVRAVGWLDRLSPADNPGQFDFADHYRAQRLLATFSIRHPGSIEHLSPAPRFAPIDALRDHARSLLAAGFTKAQAVDHALLRALLLGDNDPQLRDIQDLFIRTGTSHHLSISGLHVAVLGGFVYSLCRLARVSPRTNAAVTLCFVIIYATAALPNPPVVRSVLLCGFVILGTLSRRSSDLIQLLALSAFAMLIYSPLDLYDVGFELSFGTVLGLMLFTRPLTETLFPVDVDVALAPKPKRSRAGRWFASQKHTLREAGVAAAVAWFVSLPMILHHFDRLNPWAAPASVLLAPAVFLSLIAGLLKVILTLLFPPLAWLWADLAFAPTWLMHYSVDWLARLPWSDFPLHPIPVPVMLLYYAALVSTLLPNLSRRTKLATMSTAAVAVITLPFSLTLLASHHPDQTRVTILSVGAGSCAVVETDAGQTLLLDAGSSGSPDVYRNVIEPYLRTRHVRRIDAAYVSHADYDHFGAIPDAFSDRGITTTYLTPQFTRDAQDSAAAAHLLHTVHPTEPLTGLHAIHLSPDTMLEVLWPPPDLTLTTNDSSMVLKLTVANHSILFPGDIQAPAMQSLLSNPAQLKSDILIAAHHGSFEPTTPAFVHAVAPTTIISSDDNTPTGKQRTFDETFPNVLHTHDHGAVTITIDHTGQLAVTPFRP